jgi:PAT family beta-lactamase induction signal transducer AmpG
MAQSEATPNFGVELASAAAPRRPPPLWLILLVTLPYGIVSGGITGTLLAYLLRHEGAPVSSMANEVALLGLPPMLYFLWSPLADFWMRRRSWLVVTSGVSAALVAAAFHIRSLASPLAVALLLAASCSIMLCNASCGGIMAALVPMELRTRMSSVHQVGNLGGGALGGGGLLLLGAHVSRGTLGLAAAAIVFLPSLAALAIDEPPLEPVAEEGLGRRLGQIWSECKTTFLRWSALPSLLLLMSPLGSGGAMNLLPGIAVDYGLSGNQVAWLNGIAGALLTAAGAMLVVLVPPRIDTRLSYTLFGLANALAIGILCLGRPRPMTYLVGTVVYLLTVGACWAVFTALVLEVVGGAGKSGCSRVAIAISLGNAPVAYMAAVDGLGAKWFGTRGFAAMDMAVSGVAAIGFLLWLGITRASRSLFEARNGVLVEELSDTAG